MRWRGSWRAPVWAAIGLVVALLAAACGTGSADAASPAGPTITLYNGQHEQTTNAIVSAFTRQTGVHVRVQSAGEDVLTAQIEQEGDRSPADVIYTENSNWLQQLDDRGLLARVDASTLANVPSRDSATNGDWVGVSARVSAMVYDPSRISRRELPRSIMQLADPRYRGKIEIAPSETDFWPVVASVAQADGRAAALSWLQGLKANAGENDSVPDNETLTSDVNQGVTDLAVVNTYYFYRLRDEVGADSMHARLAYFAPGDPGYVESISGAAVLESSRHQAAAQEFLRFLTDHGGQTALARSDSFEYPLHPGVPANPALPPIDRLHPAPFTPAQLGAGLVAQQLLQQAGLI